MVIVQLVRQEMREEGTNYGLCEGKGSCDLCPLFRIHSKSSKYTKLGDNSKTTLLSRYYY